MVLKELKSYPMAEAIYIIVFDISSEDLLTKPKAKVFPDYTHLKENVNEILETLTERHRTMLRLVLDEKLTMKAAGDAIGVSGSRAQQIFHKAVVQLRTPFRMRFLDGTRRRSLAETKKQLERRSNIKHRWEKLGAEILQRNKQQQLDMAAQLQLELGSLSLTPECEQKLAALEIKTVGDLLEKFPYDPRTNGLTGLTIAGEIDDSDYREIWSALFVAGLLVHMPELPDFDALKKAEEAAITARNETKPVKCNIPISDLGLKEKSCNLLLRNGILTIGELLDRLNVSVDNFLTMSKDNATQKVYYLGICHDSRDISEIAIHVHDKLKEVYPGIALDDEMERALDELDTRVREISNGHSYIRKAPRWEEKGPDCYIYHRSTYKTFVFRKTNMFDLERRHRNHHGANEIYFTLPEELNELTKFVEHDEKLYRNAHSEK